jgi:hypothetical protein
VLLFFLIAAAIACVDAVKVLRYGGLAEGCLALSVLGGLILAMAELSTLLWAFLLFNMGSLRAVSGNQAHLSGASGRGAAASSRPRPLSLYADRSGGGAESAEREAEA